MNVVGDLNVSGEINSTGLNVAGNTDITNNLSVGGNVNITGNVTISGNISQSTTPDANTLYAKSLPKAWVFFDGLGCTGTGNTCPLNASFNIDNVTRGGPGDYTIYWDRDFASEFYAISIEASAASSQDISTGIDVSQSASSIRIFTRVNSILGDRSFVQIIAFGEQ